MRCEQDTLSSSSQQQLPAIPQDWIITTNQQLHKLTPHLQMISLQFRQTRLILQFIQSSPYANKTFTYIPKKQSNTQQIQHEQMLFKTICGQNFVNMTGLYLGNFIRQFIKAGNKINNIEPLTWLNAPMLEILHINDNHITQFKPFIKTLFKELHYFVASRNPNMSYQYLHRSWFANNMVYMMLNDFDSKLRSMSREQAELSKLKYLTPFKALSADTLSNSLLAKLPMQSVHNLVLLTDRFDVRKIITKKFPQYRQTKLFLGQDRFAAM